MEIGEGGEGETLVWLSDRCDVCIFLVRPHMIEKTLEMFHIWTAHAASEFELRQQAAACLLRVGRDAALAGRGSPEGLGRSTEVGQPSRRRLKHHL